MASSRDDHLSIYSTCILLNNCYVSGISLGIEELRHETVPAFVELTVCGVFFHGLVKSPMSSTAQMSGPTFWTICPKAWK